MNNVSYASKWFNYTSGDSLLISLPKNHYLITFFAHVGEGFNAGTDNQASLGTDADPALLASLTDINVAGPINFNAGNLTSQFVENAADYKVFFNLTGTPATTGKLLVCLLYILTPPLS